jgi:uncharacterized MAPEG superfamily protein
MTVELAMLAYAVALLFVLILIQAAAGVQAQGLTPMAGSRDNLKEPTAFQARMKRVVDNHREGLTLFAPLALIAAVTHATSPLIPLGAQLFFYARVVHAGLYIFGVPLIRPLAWVAGIVGTGMVFLGVFQLA